ncbi:MAG: hypothetical protein PHE43_01740 [Candidatus Nanoarchaeia archaeon]|nr:hypothetical protein [Candidatus Nanoarchaeia archaeon]
MEIHRSDLVIIISLVLFVGFFVFFSPSYIGMQAVDNTNAYCGDNVCTSPIEDEIICPEDCFKENKFPYWLIIIVLVLLIVGLIYFNLYKGRKDLRELTKGKSPYTTIKDYDNLKSFVKKEIGNGIKLKEITLKLAEKGWTKKQIEYAYDDVLWDQRKVFIDLTPKQSKNLEELTDYLNKCKKLHLEKRIAKINLLKKGWKRSDIKEGFRKVGY